MRRKMNQVDKDTPVWGAAEIGAVIGKDERATFHMLENGLLPARKVGGRWVSARKKLLAAVIGDENAA
jgi:hypothetical protein